MQPIERIVGQARRRMRARAALEAGTVLVPVAAAAALAGAGPPLLGAIVASGALVAAAWPRDDEAIARRIDRASGLADRLSTAIAFTRVDFTTRDPVTRAMVDLAVADAIRVAPRADVRAAAPYGVPRAARVATASVMIAALIAMLPDEPLEGVGRAGTLDRGVVRVPAHDAPVFAEKDLEYIEHLLREIRIRGASPQSIAWADAVEDRVVAAGNGMLDRETLLEELAGLAVPGELGPAGEDVLQAIWHAPPPPPPPPGPPPTVPPPGPGPGPAPDHDGIGTEHDDELTGAPTPRGGDTRDERLRGERGEGPSRRETLLSAAEDGFAAAEYERVYAEYTDVVEEVMRAQKVPSTRRYLIQRYFHQIRPGER